MEALQKGETGKLVAVINVHVSFQWIFMDVLPISTIFGQFQIKFAEEGDRTLTFGTCDGKKDPKLVHEANAKPRTVTTRHTHHHKHVFSLPRERERE